MFDRTQLSRRRFLSNFAFASGAVATGVGSWVIPAPWANAAEAPIKVGIATDLTGPIAYAGNADANVAKMVIKEINAGGGLLGRPLELYIEDTASNESVAVGNVRKLIQRDKVDMVLGGITSSMRNAIRTRSSRAARRSTSIRSSTKAKGVHALSVLHRTDAGAAVRRVHSLADQERRQEVRAAERQLRLAAHAQRLCPQGDRGQWRRGRVRGILSARPGRLLLDRQPHHLQQGRRRLQHRHPAGRRPVLQAAL